jgi:predicted dehydrogenase
MKVLIAGFGSVGRRHFRNLKSLGVDDISFYRSSRSTLPVDEIGNCEVFHDLDAALATRPAAVIVANPTSLHLPVALAAARGGADLFLEKPVSDSLDGCAALEDICRDRQLVTMVGCQFRFHPLLRRLKQQLEDRKCGAPVSVRAEYGDNITRWHPWEDHRTSYSARASMGGGVILTLIHPIDYLYWIFGSAVSAGAVVHKVAALETDVPDDVADIALEFAGGVKGLVHLDFVQDPATHRLEVSCERGSARLDFAAGRLDWLPSGSAAPITDVVPEGFDRNDMFVDEMKSFLTSVKTRRPSEVPLADGIAVLDIALRAKQNALQHHV